MNLKELNHAGEHAIFGSIEVLGDIDGKGMRTIRREISSMQQQQANFTRKIDNYWSDLSNDGIITPVEKTSLLKEWEGIAQSYTALYTQASEKQLTNTPYWIDYADAYEALKTELFTTEKIFDNMYESTTLTDKDDFNTIFSEYYYSEKFVTLAITMGLIDKLGLRALTSLQDPGENGELGLYRGELYQMVDGVWTKIGTETYLGILDELPEDPLDTQYFLAGDTIAFLDELYINEEPLLINGDTLGIVRLTIVGKMYYYNGEHWLMADEDDPRYLAVLSDYMKLNNALPNVMNDALVNVARNQLNVKNYLGVANLAPISAVNGDYFVYSGVETTDWKPGRIYLRKNNQWKKIEPDSDFASQYYMTALQDILILEAAGDGYFSTVFCNAFFTNKASINALKVHTIYLENTGAIESANQEYSPGSVGLRIDAAGNIDANGTTHIGGTCTIDGNTAIGGRADVNGAMYIQSAMDVNGTAYLHGRTIIEGDAKFSGDIISGPLKLLSTTPSPRTITYQSGDELRSSDVAELIGGQGTYKGYTFNYIRIYVLSQSGGGWEHQLELYASNVGKVYEETHVERTSTTKYILEATMTYTWEMPSSAKTFSLEDLPTTRPGAPNIVYRDGNNLMIS